MRRHGLWQEEDAAFAERNGPTYNEVEEEAEGAALAQQLAAATVDAEAKDSASSDRIAKMNVFITT